MANILYSDLNDFILFPQTFVAGGTIFPSPQYFFDEIQGGYVYTLFQPGISTGYYNTNPRVFVFGQDLEADQIGNLSGTISEIVFSSENRGEIGRITDLSAASKEFTDIVFSRIEGNRFAGDQFNEFLAQNIGTLTLSDEGEVFRMRGLVDYLTSVDLGAGNDTLDAGRPNASILTVDGGAGYDVLSLRDFGVPDTFVVNLEAGIVRGGDHSFQFTGFEEIQGNPYVERYIGSSDNDTIFAAGRGDSISGGSGDDWIEGRFGDDTLFGGEGDDLLIGGEGDDIIYLGGGDDTAKGEAGDDLLFADAGNGILDGGLGEDTVTFNTSYEGIFVFLQGVAIDISTGSASAKVGDTTAQFELVSIENAWGTIGDDEIVGDSSENELYGRQGDDTILGQAGNDEIFAAAGNQVLDGGADIDVLRFDTFSMGVDVFGQGVDANLSTGEAEARSVDQNHHYTLRSFEGLWGSNHADVLIGDAGNNFIRGRDGDDTIKGGAGNDTISGEGGNDVSLYDGASTQFTVQFDFLASEIYIIDRTGDEGTDTQGTNILRFSDRDFTAVSDGSLFPGSDDFDKDSFKELVEVYIAYFNRAPDAEGLHFWALALLNGTTIDTAAELFFDQPETRKLYDSGSDESAFVQNVYGNVLGRSADVEGASFWTNALRTGDVSPGQFIRSFLLGVDTDIPPNASQELASQFAEDRAFLSSKTEIGLSYGATHGMSDIDVATELMAEFDGSTTSLAAAHRRIEDAYLEATADDGTGEFLIQLIGFSEVDM